jgi:hypothetical protein
MFFICSAIAVCHEVPGLISSSSNHGLIPSPASFLAISRTAGLSSLVVAQEDTKDLGL